MKPVITPASSSARTRHAARGGAPDAGWQGDVGDGAVGHQLTRDAPVGRVGGGEASFAGSGTSDQAGPVVRISAAWAQ